MGHAVHRHLALLHGLQQSGLGAAGGTVELIGQKQIAQRRARLVLHLSRLLIIKREAGDVGGHHVGGKLHPVVVQGQGPGEGQSHGGLAHAGDVLQENVAPGQNGQQRTGEHLVLAHDRLLHFLQNTYCLVHAVSPHFLLTMWNDTFRLILGIFSIYVNAENTGAAFRRLFSL